MEVNKSVLLPEALRKVATHSNMPATDTTGLMFALTCSRVVGHRSLVMGHDWRFLPLSSESEEVKPPPQSWQHLQSDDPGQAKRPSFGRDWQNLSTAEPQKSDLCGHKNDWRFLSLPEPQQQATTGPAEVTSKRKQVSIAASHWAAFAVSAKERKLSVYEENGMNLARIQGAIKSGRSCKNGCMKHVTADEVNSWCKAFHMADDDKRRLCIYSLYHPDVTDWHAFTSCQGQRCANPDSAANQKQDRFSLHVNGQSMCVCNVSAVFWALAVEGFTS